ncbi:uncharacterized protein LOC131427482 [Malaya genurostris]|nr:uncharacterized protein LOC131427482 [Malaya genurostris]
MISKLKSRFDKTESDIIQRFKFNNRIQNPDESVEDFVLSIKLQAEFCNFGNFKESAIRERIVAGLRDKVLQQRLLNEENLTLDSAEKLIATWEMAGANARTLGIASNEEQIASMRQNEPNKGGYAYKKLAKIYNRAQAELNQSQRFENRGSVKDRLGFKPYKQSNAMAKEERTMHKTTFKPAGWRNNQDTYRPESRICDYCGIRGHLKRKCFKLKNSRKEAVKFVDSAEPGPSTLSELFSRFRPHDSESEDEKNSDTCWKRGNHGSSRPTSSR